MCAGRTTGRGLDLFVTVETAAAVTPAIAPALLARSLASLLAVDVGFSSRPVYPCAERPYSIPPRCCGANSAVAIRQPPAWQPVADSTAIDDLVAQVRSVGAHGEQT